MTSLWQSIVETNYSLCVSTFWNHSRWNCNQLPIWIVTHRQKHDIVCVFMPEALPHHPTLSIHAYMHAYRHALMHASMRACMHACMHEFIHESMHPGIHASMHPGRHASVRPSVSPSVRPSIHTVRSREREREWQRLSALTVRSAFWDPVLPSSLLLSSSRVPA